MAPPIDTIRAGSDIVTSRLRASCTVMPAATAAPPSTKQPVTTESASVRQIVIVGSLGGSLGQDQLVLRRQPQAIIVPTMRDDDFPLGREQFAAVDSAAVHGEKTRRGWRIFGIFSGASDIIS